MSSSDTMTHGCVPPPPVTTRQVLIAVIINLIGLLLVLLGRSL